MTEAAPTVHMIPIEQIHILNPRSRNKATFQDIMSNISQSEARRRANRPRTSRRAVAQVSIYSLGEPRRFANFPNGEGTTPLLDSYAFNRKQKCFNKCQAASSS
jgi:hypothetical protein